MVTVVVVVLSVITAILSIPFDKSRLSHLWPVLLIAAGVAIRMANLKLPVEAEWIVAIGAILLFATWIGASEPTRVPLAVAALGIASAAVVARTVEPAPADANGLWWLFGISALTALALRSYVPNRVRREIVLIPWVTAACAAPMALAHVTKSFAWNSQWILALAIISAGLFLAAVVPLAPRIIAGTCVVVAAAVAGYVLSSHADFGVDMLLAIVAAIGAAVVSIWMADESTERVMPTLATALIWFPVATLGFAAARGFGITVVTAVGLVTVVALGGFRLSLGLAPLVALGLFRVLQATQPESTRAFDLGQHYALLGFLVGVIAILAIVEWNWPTESLPRMMSTVAVLVALGFALPAASVYLGQKGSVGLFVGVTAAAVLAPAIRRASLSAGAIGLLAAGYISAFMPRWIEWMELTRAERLPKLAMLFAGAAIATIIAVIVARPAAVRAEVTT